MALTTMLAALIRENLPEIELPNSVYIDLSEISPELNALIDVLDIGMGIIAKPFLIALISAFSSDSVYDTRLKSNLTPRYKTRSPRPLKIITT